MMDNSIRACYKQISRMTIERAYEDILSENDNEYWSAVRFFRNHRDYMEIVCHVAELDPITTYKGYKTLVSLRDKGITRNSNGPNQVEQKTLPCKEQSHEVSK